ncbi:sugar transferase [Phycicoccus sonneratiae]|uniref:Sugar transferase n=1 Tax=Phycicoccus sonneratiae TaxID=2807628 RepID=A0ABS2CML3_9MICO|nr:sugar transferase [Phycicoccus sonneraticus]MBM6401112.1 sugar transferase [Phycicoccus sonneraticus]
MADHVPVGLTRPQAAAKRTFDLVVGGVVFVVTAPISLAAVVAARRDTGLSGIFAQQRVGRGGRLVTVHKIRTMRPSVEITTSVTTSADPRITPLGRRLRAWKVDELPQLVDVLAGRMSLVGPRPDIEGWADRLTGEDRIVLSVRPGITGPASLAFRHEERMLAAAEDPEAYNRDVIWPAKVRINRAYVEEWSLLVDVRCLMRTVFSVAGRFDAG